jgi:hypothetical protein
MIIANSASVTSAFPLASDDEEAVDRGYVTEDDYHWVCETCFADFRVQFGWSSVQTLT